MARIICYCVRCGCRFEPNCNFGGNDNCENCCDYLARERDWALEKFRNNPYINEDYSESEVEQAVLDKYGSCRKEYYCEYNDSCTTSVEEGTTYCDYHYRVLEQEKERSEQAWEDFKKSL